MDKDCQNSLFPRLLNALKVSKWTMINHIKCFVGLALGIKFMMWRDSLRLGTVPDLNFGRMEAVKCPDGARCCHTHNLNK